LLASTATRRTTAHSERRALGAFILVDTAGRAAASVACDFSTAPADTGADSARSKAVSGGGRTSDEAPPGAAVAAAGVPKGTDATDAAAGSVLREDRGVK